MESELGKFMRRYDAACRSYPCALPRGHWGEHEVRVKSGSIKVGLYDRNALPQLVEYERYQDSPTPWGWK